MHIAFAILAILALSLPAAASDEDLTAILEARCPDGQAANDYEFWEFIANNAVRTADAYAVERNPMATFVHADVDVVFQIGGEHAGGYLVKLLSTTPTGTAFAMLRPNFNFCADPSQLDDEREDLFTVVAAKLNGRPF